jgi:hypothetical protein
MSLAGTAQTRSRNPYGNRIPPESTNRHRALARLYERRAAVDQLIDALERYQRHRDKRQEETRSEAVNVVGMLS